MTKKGNHHSADHAHTLDTLYTLLPSEHRSECVQTIYSMTGQTREGFQHFSFLIQNQREKNRFNNTKPELFKGYFAETDDINKDAELFS